jgi:hypothetical protein
VENEEAVAIAVVVGVAVAAVGLLILLCCACLKFVKILKIKSQRKTLKEKELVFSYSTEGRYDFARIEEQAMSDPLVFR